MPSKAFSNRIKAKIILQALACCAVAITLLAAGGYAFYHLKYTEKQRENRAHIRTTVNEAQRLVLEEMKEPISELMYLASLSEVTEAFTSIISADNLADLVSLSRTKKKYDQVRLIDRYGMEVIRINYNNGSPAVVDEAELQFKGGRYYFSEANQLDVNQIYISPLDLNIENNTIEQPLKPVIRLATPLFDKDGKRRGIAILNYFGQHLFPYLENISLTAGEQAYLLNEDGYYLYSKNPSINWGFMFGDRKDFKFQNSYPKVWAKIIKSESGQIVTQSGVFTFVTINLNDVGHSSECKIISQTGKWKIVVFTPDQITSANSSAMFGDVFLIVLGLSLLAILISIAGGRMQMNKARTEIAVAEMNKSYERFVPREFLKLLNKERYRDITLDSNVRKRMGILFSDIRSYTNISESLEPEEVLSFLNEYFQNINGSIADNRGFVDSFHGDALLALFAGTPDQAVRAGIEMRQRLAEFNKNRSDAGEEAIEIGVGIHYGEVTLGTVGTTYRMQATVIGDAVNLASRIESATKTFKIDIVVTGSAIEMMENPDDFYLREIDTVRVKGKEHPVKLYEAFDNDPPEVRNAKSEIAPLMNSALKMYKAGEFEQALEIFKVCASKCPEDSIPPIYIKRCSTFLRIPPGPGWTGVSPV